MKQAKIIKKCRPKSNWKIGNRFKVIPHQIGDSGNFENVLSFFILTIKYIVHCIPCVQSFIWLIIWNWRNRNIKRIYIRENLFEILFQWLLSVSLVCNHFENIFLSLFFIFVRKVSKSIYSHNAFFFLSLFLFQFNRTYNNSCEYEKPLTSVSYFFFIKKDYLRLMYKVCLI